MSPPWQGVKHKRLSVILFIANNIDPEANIYLKSIAYLGIGTDTLTSTKKVLQNVVKENTSTTFYNSHYALFFNVSL